MQCGVQHAVQCPDAHDAIAHNPKVVGSNPTPATISPSHSPASRGVYRLEAVFFRRFNRAEPVEVAGVIICSNTRAASDCSPGMTCW